MKVITNYRKVGNKVAESVLVKQDPETERLKAELKNVGGRIEELNKLQHEQEQSPSTPTDSQANVNRPDTLAEYVAGLKARSLGQTVQDTVAEETIPADFRAAINRHKDALNVTDYMDTTKLAAKVAYLDIVDRINNAPKPLTQEQMDELNIPKGVASESPFYFVDKHYYVMLAYGRVYIQKDEAQEQYPYVLISKGNDGHANPNVITVNAIDGVQYIGAADFKRIVDAKPSYESVCTAYKLKSNSRVQMDLSKAVSVFN